MADLPGTNIAKYFQSVNKWVHDAISSGGSVLIHCFSGVSRSATLAIAYLMEYHKLTVDNAN